MKSRILNRIAILTLAACFISAAPVSIAQTPSWLIGTWELAKDPSGERRDYMDFTRDGQITSISHKGQRVRGAYQVNADVTEVEVTFVLPDGRVLPTFPIKIDEDRRELHIVSGKNGIITTYRKGISSALPP
jgi:hypothetical protein